MTLVAGIVAEVSVDLNDHDPGHEYTLWTAPQLASYAREALVTLGEAMPDLFLYRGVVKLKAGPGWQEVCECSDITRILGESTADGTLIRLLADVRDDEGLVWAGPVEPCPAAPRDYQLASYSIHRIDASQFRVFPPVPPGVDKYVVVECYQEPTGKMDSDVPVKVVAMVKQWMLYRALSVDSENNPSIMELAGMHRNTYFDLYNTAVEKYEREKREHGNNIRTVQTTASD